MPKRVRTTENFDKEVARLARKFPAVLDEVADFISRLKRDDLMQLPGRRIRRTGFTVYKERLPNRSARRGKRGGFRIYYWVRERDYLVLVAICSKTEHEGYIESELGRMIAHFD
jgi:mRNA-degrading endonuclease RelE of RelBE toxin-antitoxin system